MIGLWLQESNHYMVRLGSYSLPPIIFKPTIQRNTLDSNLQERVEPVIFKEARDLLLRVNNFHFVEHAALF